jgi:hypothetical protein
VHRLVELVELALVSAKLVVLDVDLPVPLRDGYEAVGLVEFRVAAVVLRLAAHFVVVDLVHHLRREKLHFCGAESRRREGLMKTSSDKLKGLLLSFKYHKTNGLSPEIYNTRNKQADSVPVIESLR